MKIGAGGDIYSSQAQLSASSSRSDNKDTYFSLLNNQPFFLLSGFLKIQRRKARKVESRNMCAQKPEKTSSS
jgi:hypothetical protein